MTKEQIRQIVRDELRRNLVLSAVVEIPLVSTEEVERVIAEHIQLSKGIKPE